MKKIKIKIAATVYRPLHFKTAESISTLAKNENIDFSFEAVDAASIATARTLLVMDYAKYDYIIFIDSDVYFSVDDFFKLLNANKPIICGAYRRLDHDDRYVGGFKGKDTSLTPSMLGDRIVSVDWVGMGMTLINTEIFTKKEMAAFEMPIGKNGRPESEDFNFCRKFPDKVFLHCGTNIVHIPREKGIYMNDKIWIEIEKVVSAYQIEHDTGTHIRDLLRYYLKKEV